MYNLQTESSSFVEVGQTICHNCGQVTVVNEGGAEKRKMNFGFIYPIMGWIFIALSFLFLPLIFGSLAIFMSIMTYFERSKTHGTFLMVFAVLFLLIGSLLSFFVTGTVFV